VSDEIDRRTFLSRTGGVVVGSTVLGSALAACGGDDTKPASTTTARAKIGGTLSIFTYAGYDDKTAEAPFLKKYGVKTKTTPVDNPDALITRLKAGGVSQFDLVSANVAQAPQLEAADVLQEVDYGRLPNTRDFLENMAPLGTRDFAVDGKAYSVPYVWGINALVYNQKRVPKTPTSWKDLLGTQYKGKIAISDAAGDNYLMWSKIMGFDPLTMNKDQLEKVTDFIIDLKKNQAKTFTSSFDDMADQLSRGDIWAVASPLWIAVPSFAAKKGPAGKDVTYTLPKEGGSTWIDGFVLAKEAPNVDTAYAYLDWMLGAEQQKTIATHLNSGVVNAKAVPLLTSGQRQVYPYDDVSKLSETAPPFEFPKGAVKYPDWVEAWKRVQAA
jgi:spermidine/putrescine transport system substrate-binding protein